MRKISFTVPIYSIDPEEVMSEDFDAEDQFKTGFEFGGAEFESVADNVAGEILTEYSSEGGAPEINDIDIENFEYDAARRSGSFTLSYSIERVFGCSDMNSHENDEMEFSFTIDLENLEFVCISDSVITRFSPE